MAALASTRPYRRANPPQLPDNGRYVAEEFTKIEQALKGLQTPSAVDISGKMDKSANLSDVTNVVTARANLLLGSAATHAATDFLQAANNLSDVSSAATARTNIGADNASNLSTGTLPDARLSNVVTAGSVGDASHIPVLTFDAHGRVTGYSNVAVSAGGSFTVGIVSPGINSVIGNDTTDKTTIASVISSTGIVQFYPGQYLIDANTTWPAGKIYRFHPGAYVQVATGVTLTINGVVDAGHYKVFGESSASLTLLGTVTGIASVKPEWWGVVPTTTTWSGNNAGACQAAINCAQASTGSDGDRVEITFGPWTYYFSQALTFTGNFTVSWNIRGAGIFRTRLVFGDTDGGGSFSGPYGLRITAGDGITNMDFQVSDFAVSRRSTAHGPSVGLLVGADNGMMSGRESLIANVEVSGFTDNMKLMNCRAFTVQRCYTWDNALDGSVDSTGHQLLLTGSGFDTATAALLSPYTSYVGDIDFLYCQFSGHVGSSPSDAPAGVVVALTDQARTNVHVSGVRFTNCFTYGGKDAQYLLQMTGSGSSIDDIWIIGGSQLEGPWKVETIGIVIFVDNGGRVLDVHVDGCYMVGNGFTKCLYASIGSGAGYIQQIFFTNNLSNNCLHEIFDIRGTNSTLDAGFHSLTKGVTVANNIITAPNGIGAANAALYFQQMDNVTVTGNTMMSNDPTNTRAWMVLFNGAPFACNWCMASGNNSGGWATTAAVATGGTVNNSSITGNI
jgi:hypothetical protein